MQADFGHVAARCAQAILVALARHCGNAHGGRIFRQAAPNALPAVFLARFSCRSHTRLAAAKDAEKQQENEKKLKAAAQDEALKASVRVIKFEKGSGGGGDFVFEGEWGWRRDATRLLFVSNCVLRARQSRPWRPIRHRRLRCWRS